RKKRNEWGYFCSRVRRVAATETTEGRTTLLANFDEICTLYGRIPDAKTGKPLFIHQDTFARVRQIRKRIALGCLSDDPRFDLYIPLTSGDAAAPTNPATRENYHCARGTNKLENFHRQIRDILQRH